MKIFKLNFRIVMIFLIITSSLSTGCGGVIGNIEIYTFNDISKKCLMESINNCYLKKPELIKSDSSIYGANTNDQFFFISNFSNEKYVFKISIFTDSFGKTCMSLDTGTKWGDVMKLESNLSYLEKRKIKKIFENSIFPLIKKEIDTSYPSI